jgi:putative ABC transport system permease protein
LDDATLMPLMVAIDPDSAQLATPGLPDVRVVPSIGERVEDGWRDVSMVYILTPELMSGYGIDLDSIATDVAFLTTATGELAVIGDRSPASQSDGATPLGNTQQLEQRHTSIPGSFITDDELQRRGWTSAPSGRWLIETSVSIDGEQLATARKLAAAAGLTIETRDHQSGLQGLRRGATAVGMLLALAILAMTVGLIRAEAAADVRTLTATGAGSGTRRSLTATTAGGLAAMAAVLGIFGAYLTLLASHVRRMGELGMLPWSQLALIGLGTPAIAAAVGWLVSGREPSAIARQPMT